MIRRLLDTLIHHVNRRPGLLVGAWLFLALLGLLAVPHLERRQVAVGAPPITSDSERARTIIVREFPTLSGTTHLVVLHGPMATEAGEDHLIERLRHLPIVRTARAWPLDAPDTRAILVVTEGSVEATDAVQALRRVTPTLPGLEVSLTGAGAASYDLFHHLGEQLKPIERISLLLSALALAYVFGSLLLVGITLAGGLLCLAILPGWLYALSHLLPVTSMNMVVAGVFALALGLDYPLFFLNRVREEHAQAPEGALARAQASAGRTILASAAVMAAGGLALAVVPMGEIRSIGWTIAASALLAALVTLTLLPALLRLVAMRWDLDPHLKLGRLSRGDRAWGVIARAVTATPGRWLAACALLFGLMIAPVAQLKTWAPYVSQLPDQLEAKRGLTRLLDVGAGGSLGPILVVFEAQDVTDPAFLAHLRQVGDRLARDPRISRVDSVASVPLSPGVLCGILRSPLAPAGARDALSPDRKATLVRLTSRLAPDDPRAADLIAALRTELADTPYPGARASVGGMQAELADTQQAFAGAMPWVLGLTLGAIGLLLGAYLRSAVLPLKAVLTNLLPILSALGVVVAVFQWGWGPDWLRSGPPGPVQSTTVTLMLSVLFAVSMDYEIFMLARIREAYDAHGENRTAIAHGLGRSGRVVLGAGLVLLAVFVPYVGIDVRGLKELGVGLSSAILIDSTLVRLVLVPAAMMALGRWNYWLPRAWSKLKQTPTSP